MPAGAPGRGGSPSAGGRKCLPNELLDACLIFYLRVYLCFSVFHHSLPNLWIRKHYHWRIKNLNDSNFKKNKNKIKNKNTAFQVYLWMRDHFIFWKYFAINDKYFTIITLLTNYKLFLNCKIKDLFLFFIIIFNVSPNFLENNICE